MSAPVMHAAPSEAGPAAIALAVPSILREDRPDGSFVLRSSEPLGACADRVGDWLNYWAVADGSRVFLAQRQGAGWRTVSYAHALQAVRSIAQSLLSLGVAPQTPVVALSDNSVNLALLSLAAMHVGRRIAVVSSAYTRLARDHGKLHAILDRLSPGLIYAEDQAQYGAAIRAWAPMCPVVYSDGEDAGSIAFRSLVGTIPGPEVDAEFERVTGGTIARILLTSGSTGAPKLVPNTHRMLCANQQMIAQCWHFIDHAQPVVLDWLPWSHTFGANHNFNLVLRNGGSLYIDSGRPTPGAIDATIAAIRDVHPTVYFNVPRGFDVLLPYLENDDDLARALFGRLDMLFFAGAALPQRCADRLRAVAQRVRTRPLFFTTEWGATETTPVVTSAHFHTQDARIIGVPVPGLELKFAPHQDKFELCVRGPSVFPGYLDDPQKTRAAFDDEGFYRMGDAGKLVDPRDPNRGVYYDGRIAEDFKLTTGAWVSVAALRLGAVSALTPYASDVVVCGHDRDEIGLLVFPTDALRELAGDTQAGQSGEDLGRHPAVRQRLSEVLRQLGQGAGSSQRPARMAILSSAPSLEAGEITDKGYINQRAVIDARADDVARLFSACSSVVHPL